MSQTAATNFDSTALAGLRGISALHIVVFHSFTYCLFEFNVYAQVSPPKSKSSMYEHISCPYCAISFLPLLYIYLQSLWTGSHTFIFPPLWILHHPWIWQNQI